MRGNAIRMLQPRPGAVGRVTVAGAASCGRRPRRFGDRPRLVARRRRAGHLRRAATERSDDAAAGAARRPGSATGRVVALDLPSDADVGRGRRRRVSKLGARRRRASTRGSAPPSGRRCSTGWRPTSCSTPATSAASGRRRRRSAGDAADPTRSAPCVRRVHVGHDRRAEGRRVPRAPPRRHRRHRPRARADDVGRRRRRCWRRPSSPTSASARSCPGTCAPARRLHLLAAVAGRPTRCGSSPRERMPVDRRRRRPDRAAAAGARLRRLRPLGGAARSSSAAARRRPRWSPRPAGASARRTRSATRRRSPAASAPAPPSTPTTTRRCTPSAGRGPASRCAVDPATGEVELRSRRR